MSLFLYCIILLCFYYPYIIQPNKSNRKILFFWSYTYNTYIVIAEAENRIREYSRNNAACSANFQDGSNHGTRVHKTGVKSDKYTDILYQILMQKIMLRIHFGYSVTELRIL